MFRGENLSPVTNENSSKSSDFSGTRKPYNFFNLQLQPHLGSTSLPLADFVIEGILHSEKGLSDRLSFIEQVLSEHRLCSRHSPRLGNTAKKTEKLLPLGVYL